MEMDLACELSGDGEFFHRHGDFHRIAGASCPWIYASGCRGLKACTIPLLGEGDAARDYRVRLHFADTAMRKTAARPFDVLLQGKTVLENFDVRRAAGGTDTAVIKEFSGVRVTDNLALSLVPRGKAEGESDSPVINAIEILAE